jgi:ATP-dependent Clp protease ATP-binding subunit ClpA
MSENRYSQHARRALQRARMLSRDCGHAEVDTSHLAVGILREEGSIGQEILSDLQMMLEEATRRLCEMHPTSENTASPLQSFALKTVLRIAGDEANALGHHYIGTEHLLLGLARHGEGSVTELWHSIGINLDQVLRRVRRQLQTGITEIGIEQAKRLARLSELSRRVINAAQQLVKDYEHDRIGLGHVLLSLARERRGISYRVLRRCDFKEDDLIADLTKPRPATGGMVEPVIDHAVDLAEKLGSHYTGTDHMLLAIATKPTGKRLLGRYGVDAAQVERLLRAAIGIIPD